MFATASCAVLIAMASAPYGTRGSQSCCGEGYEHLATYNPPVCPGPPCNGLDCDEQGVMTDVEIHFDGVNVTGGTIELCEDQGAQYLESVGGIDYDVCRSLTNPCVFSLIPVPTVRFWFPPEQPQPPQSEFVYLIDTSEPGTFGITNGVDGGPSDCQAPGNESREASVTVVVKDKCLGTSGSATNWQAITQAGSNCPANPPWQSPQVLGSWDCYSITVNCEPNPVADGFVFRIVDRNGAAEWAGSCIYDNGMNGVRVKLIDSACGWDSLDVVSHIVYDPDPCPGFPTYKWKHRQVETNVRKGIQRSRSRRIQFMTHEPDLFLSNGYQVPPSEGEGSC